MDKIPIKLYGLQRTGTNYVTNLIQKNFGDEVRFNNAGWKHGHYFTHPEEPNIVIVSKDPYAWMLSCYKYWKELPEIGPDLTDTTFEEFVTTSPVMLEGSSDIPYLIRATNLMEYYNNMYFHWLSIRFKRDDRKICLIRYEDALADVDKTLSDIASVFGLRQKSYTNIENEVVWGYDDWSNQTGETKEYLKDKVKKFEKRDFYVEAQYLDSYNDNMLKFIHESWDNWLMAPERLGYKVRQSVFEKLKLSF